jgi:hypothetical protein
MYFIVVNEDRRLPMLPPTVLFSGPAVTCNSAMQTIAARAETEV